MPRTGHCSAGRRPACPNIARGLVNSVHKSGIPAQSTCFASYRHLLLPAKNCTVLRMAFQYKRAGRGTFNDFEPEWRTKHIQEDVVSLCCEATSGPAGNRRVFFVREKRVFSGASNRPSVHPMQLSYPRRSDFTDRHVERLGSRDMLAVCLRSNCRFHACVSASENAGFRRSNARG